MIYLVTGKQPYLGTPPGEQFVADLDPGMQERAVRRGAIEVIDTQPLRLDVERAVLPAGWKPPMKGD